MSKSYSEISDMDYQVYARQLFKDDANFHIDPWGAVLMRNLNPRTNKLAQFSSLRDYKKEKIALWVRCIALVFRNPQGNLFHAFACETCPMMFSLSSFSMKQSPADLQKYKCTHSLLAETIVSSLGDWQELFRLNTNDLAQNDECFKIDLNNHIKHHTFASENSFLAVVKRNKKVSILSSLNSKTKTPYCINICSRKPCKCFWLYKRLTEAQAAENHPGEDIEVEHYWQRKKTSKPLPEHYEDIDKFEHHNETPFKYPIFRDNFLHNKFMEKVLGNLEIPENLIPTLKEMQTCKHNNLFSNDDSDFVMLYNKTTVHNKLCETGTSSKIFARKTVSGCKCMLQPDTHQYLLWNLGNGRLIDYSMLLDAAHQWAHGLTLTSQIAARNAYFNNLKIHSTLTENDLDRAVTGFCALMEFEKSDFACIDCGDTPSYIIGNLTI